MCDNNKVLIKIDNLYKSFEKKEVLSGICLDVYEGDFFGVFGKNGAGKTTLFKHILGLLSPTKGDIYINNFKVGSSQNKKNKQIGYLPENVSLYGHMSVVDNLKVAAYSAGEKLSADEIHNILNMVNLCGSERVKGKDLSLGMKRRLQFAMATMTKPADILILDEPTNGMDINGVLWLRDYMKELKKCKKTILVCSHSLNVMESLIDKYCILKNGKIIKESLWNNQADEGRYIISFEGPISKEDEQHINDFAVIESKLENKITIKSGKNLLEIAQLIKEKNIAATDIERKRQNLEEIFIESVAKDDE